MITLVKDTIDKGDIDALIEWLKTEPILTKNKLTIEFEKKWSEWLGKKYSVFVNSGSSANLAMIYALKVSGRMKNNKVVVPALCWATTLAPIIQLGLEPILCDIEPNTLSIDPDRLEEIIKKENPAAVLYINPLGFVGDAKRLKWLSETFNFFLLEDSCETLGTVFEGKKSGAFGDMSTMSFFFGHHMSTIEGGMVSTDDEELYKLLLMVRSHGWDRDLDEDTKHKLRAQHNVDEFHALYTFYIPGFNIRATDLQAFIGLNQLKKIDGMCQKRFENYQYYLNHIQNNEWQPDLSHLDFVSNFAYPIIHSKKDRIVKKLRENEVESRPLICGSMNNQPFYNSRYPKVDLPVAQRVHDYGLYVPNNDKMTQEEIKFICDIINKEMAQ